MKMLELKGVRKNFGGIRAVDSFSLDVAEGEIVGLIGPNGAGKSTLFNCVAGVFPPTAGEILFRGTKINNQKPWDLCRKGLARTFQIVKPFASRTVLYNVMVGAFATTDKRAEAEQRALEVLSRLHMGPQKDVRAGNLTIADRKRLEIARALATQPKLLLLDEVMAGLRPTEVDEMVAIIKRLREGGGDHFRDRAHHARHHGSFGPDRGPALRRQDRRGASAGDRARRAGDQGLSGGGLWRSLRSGTSRSSTGTCK